MIKSHYSFISFKNKFFQIFLLNPRTFKIEYLYLITEILNIGKCFTPLKIDRETKEINFSNNKNYIKQKKNFCSKNIYNNKLNQMDSANYFEISRKSSDIILTPKEGYDNVLVFMHGLGDSANGYLDFFNEESYRPIPKRMKVVLLTAPVASVTINGGSRMNSWYDILSFRKEKGSISEEDVIKNSIRIKKTVEEEAKVFKNNYKKVFLGGFSQGCCMALYSALTLEQNVGGVIGLSGVLFPFIELNEEKKEIPIFLAHGKFDSVIPYQYAEESYKRLHAMKFNIKFHPFDEEHTIDESTMEEMKNFLNKEIKV